MQKYETLLTTIYVPELKTLAVALHEYYEASTLSLTQMEVAQERASSAIIDYIQRNNYSLHKIHKNCI